VERDEAELCYDNGGIEHSESETTRRCPMQIETSGIRRILKFCISGIAGVSVYYLALYGLTEYLGFWYVASAMVAFVLNYGLNFILQRYWTFENKVADNVGRHLVLYSAMMLSFFAGNTMFLYIMVEYLQMWYMKAQVILTAIISILSFIFSGMIFRRET